METIETILEQAQQRAQNLGLPYKGALLPMEAYRILQESAQTQLVDVRSQAELDWVGRIPDAKAIELRSYPGMQPNPEFLKQLTEQVDKNLPVLFICRSGARSDQAAKLATEASFTSCYNILEGFEGDKDEKGHRGTSAGWKAAGLPWEQS
ncbi:MAG: rhodanese-like domain-containing protein [Nitrosomonas sp.]|nr:rhodanese-like domain-containing protein [Nitrosomonas sp.]